MGNLIASAGIVAIPLLLFSVLSLTLIGERSYFWFRVWRRQDAVIQKALRLLQTNEDAAIKLLQKQTDLPVPRIFLEALELQEPTPEEFRLALESAAQSELPTLRRFSTALDSIVAVSPLLGLLGTVLGLMASFSSLTLGDIGQSDAIGVTGGISEALSSTVLGLVVAIVTLLFSNTFRGFYRRQTALIREYGGRLELIYRRKHRLYHQ
ncbi:MotA/TolQ/ExbB proton channel family protein [Baaleninema simplex]|uniref:MotA/TolQ/ExbB proton channel family protein n=1 Tax=Baaleninema simplex TaxID=2862350 RepID=UPI00034A0FE2|nr:MotA/TolQ/ExbB proton channel family protein [Baaleninema simplex]